MIQPQTDPQSPRTALPAAARVVIVGGGVIGCSIAYHLSLLGWRDIVLLERLRLTHGTTWHAAGLVGQLRGSSNLTRLMRYGAQLYGELERQTGQATGWRGVGSLRLAASPERWLELRRAATMARGSFVTPVWRPVRKVASITSSESAKALSTAPTSSLRSKQRLSPSDAWMTGVLASSAVSGSVTAGSSS